MVICNIQKVDENGKVIQKLTQIPNMPEKINLEIIFRFFQISAILHVINYLKKNFLIRKDLKKEFILKIFSLFHSFCWNVKPLHRPRISIINTLNVPILLQNPYGKRT
jgi:hypothetical protein